MPYDQSLYDIDDVCATFKCSASTIWRWIAAGTFPAPIKIGGISRWTHAAISGVISAAETKPPSVKKVPTEQKSLKVIRRVKLSSKR
jgi:predicted DNA-binding transcriptional regulator AlpA